MSDKSGSLLDFLASGINRQDPCINAVLADENGSGAAANEIKRLLQFINYYTRTPDIKNHKGDTLEAISMQFAKLPRRLTETDPILLRRFLALTKRRGDTVWGTAQNIKNVFEEYFDGINCHVAENTGDVNLLTSGCFNDWEIAGGAAFVITAQFANRHGLYFNGDAGQSCKQVLNQLLLEGNYTFHFFLQGKCGLVIQNEKGQYFNANSQKFTGDTVLQWVDEEVVNIFESPAEWQNVHCFVVLLQSERDLSFKFVSMEGFSAKIDYVRFYRKPLNPAYTLVFLYDGYFFFDKTLHLADSEPGGNDRYYNNAYIVGPMALRQNRAFMEVLDIVRPNGIQVFTEILEKGE